MISGLGIRGHAANALVQLGAGVGSFAGQYAALNLVNAVAPGAGAGQQLNEMLGPYGGSLGKALGSQVFSALGSFAGNQLAELIGLDPQLAPLIVAPIQAGIAQVGQNLLTVGAGLLDKVDDAMVGAFWGAVGGVLGSLAIDALGFDSAGAQLGSSIGSAIGSFFFGPIGSFAGSVIGGFIGEFADEVVDFVSDVAKSVWKGIKGLFSPILLDLDGTGVEITELHHSTIFMDSSGDGLEHRTAWAAAGNGVLFFDPDGRNAITEDRQFIFTKWDPTAADDMAALRATFDSNGDGKLTAADADFAKFKVLVTNANGSTTVQTLAQLNITEINLRPDTTNIELPDGSIITGQTTFTRGNGTTGTVANTSLAAELAGFKIDQTITTDAQSNRVVDIKAYAANGDLAFASKTVTSPTGNLTNISYDDNGDGVWDRLQTITKVTNANGSKTTTITTKVGAIDAAAILVSIEQTTVSADNKIVTINRDTMGGGWFDNQEVRTTNADGSRTIVISKLSKNGTVINKQSETFSIDGTTRTQTFDADGDLDTDTAMSQTIVTNAAGVRTETNATRNGDNSLRLSETTVVSADGKSRTITVDADGDGDTDTQTLTTLTGGAGTTSTSTITVKNADGTVRNSSTVTQSGDALAKTTVTDADGDGDTDWTSSDVTTIVSGVRTENHVVTNNDGSIRMKEKTVLAADKVSSEHWIDLNQNGIFEATDLVRTVTVNGTTQARTETTYGRAPDGTLLSTQVSVTSANGLVTNTTVDTDGNGTIDTRVTDTTVLNSANNTTRTIVTNNGDNSARSSTRIDTVSAGTAVTGGVMTLVEATKTDVNGDSVYDSVMEKQVIKLTDGSRVEQISEFAGNGTTLITKQVVTTSADRLVKVSTFDSNGDGVIDRSTESRTAADGSTAITDKSFHAANITASITKTTTSANGLNVAVEEDFDGDGRYETRTEMTTVLAANGSQTVTELVKDETGTVLSSSTSTVSGNGLTRTVLTDRDGNGVNETQVTDTTVLNANGSSTRTITTKDADGTNRNIKTITVSDDGLVTTEKSDTDGNGTFEFTKTETTVLGNDGGRTTTTEIRNGSSVLLGKTLVSNSDDGRLVVTSSDINGDSIYDKVETRTIANDGSKVVLSESKSATGALLMAEKVTVSGNGLVTTSEKDRNGDGVFESKQVQTTSLAQNGQITVITESRSSTNALLASETRATSDDGLSVTFSKDFDGNGTNEETGTINRSFTTDGTWTTVETILNGNGSLNKRSTVVENQITDTTTTSVDLDGNGANDTVMSLKVLGDGSIIETVTSLSAAGTKHHETITETLANGQQVRIFDDKNGDGVIDRTISTRTYLADDIYSLGSLITEQLVVDAKRGLLESKTISDSLNGLNRDVYTRFNVNNVSYIYNVDITTTFGSDGRWTTLTTTQDSSFNNLILRSDIVDQNGLYELHQVNYNVAAGASWDRSILVQKTPDQGTTKTSSFWNLSGTLVEKKVETTSANQRTSILLHDVNGDAVNDYRKSATIDLSQKVTTTWEKLSSTGVVTSRVVQSTTGNGMTIEEQIDISADGVFDVRDSITTSVSAANVTTQTVATYFGNTLSENHVTTISANGLTQTEQIDFNFGDSFVDETRIKTKTFNTDGTETVSETTTYANGDLRSKSLIATSADKRVVIYTVDRDGNDLNDAITRVVTSTSGDVTTTEQYFNVAGYELVGSKSFTSYDGLTTKIDRSNGVYETLTKSLLSPNSYTWSNGVTPTTTASRDVVTHVDDGAGMITWTYQSTKVVSGANQTTTFSAIVDAIAMERAMERASAVYDVVFDRAMFRSESETLVKHFTGNELNVQNLATALVSSAEFTTRYGTLANSEFVQQIYINALGRPPSMQEASDLVTRLAAATVTRAQLIVEIADSAEHRAVGNDHMPTNNVNWEYAPHQFDRLIDREQARAVVERLVDTIYDRNASSYEKQFLVDKLLTGTDGLEELSTLLNGVSGSLQGNYSNGLLGLTGSSLVDQAFKNALNRLPTTAESQLWTAHLTSGRFTVAQFLVTLSESVEHRTVGNVHFSTAFTPLTVLNGTTANNTLTATVASEINGLAGVDTMTGSAGSDKLVGGTGIDTMNGAAGSDRYEWSLGDGNDVINDASTSQVEHDVLALTNVASSGVTLTRSSTNLLVTVTSSGETITINNMFSAAIDGRGIETITFSNGVNWTLRDILANTRFNGTSAAETLTGTVRADNLYGLGLNDTLNGGAGNDKLVGGTGVDMMDGGTGSDRYEWTIGDGNDTINDTSTSVTEEDILVLTNVASTGVALTRSGANLIVTHTASGATITVSNRFVGPTDGRGIESIIFSDGVKWSLNDILNNTNTIALAGTGYADNIAGTSAADTISGAAGNDKLVGGLGIDTMDGGTGSDRYEWAVGDGNDVINDTSTSALETDTLVLTNVNSNGISLARSGTNMIITHTASGAVITINSRYAGDGRGIENITFADGISWTLNELMGRAVSNGTAAADTMTGSSYDDRIFGLGGVDNLNGGAGEDYIEGGLLGDTINGGSGRDTVGYASATAGVNVNLSVTTAQNGIVIGSTATEATGDVISNVENIRGSTFGDNLVGDANSNMIWGGTETNGQVDYLYGGDGNDFIYGEGGNDRLFGGNGADYLDGGDGDEDVVDYSSSAPVFVNLAAGYARNNEAEGDTLRNIEWVFGSANYSGNTIYGNDKANFIMVGGTFGDTFANEVHGGGGNDTLQGSIVVDKLYGGDGDDLLEGGEGADILDGGLGVDKIRYSFSGAGVNVNLVTNINTGGDAQGDSIIGVENFIGSFYADTFVGDTANNSFEGGQGDDNLDGGAGTDTLDGGDGNDILKGGDGTDVFYTGQGADNVDGGAGTLDIVYYNRSTSAVTVNLTTNVNTGGEAVGDIIANVERVYGTNYDDNLTGDANANYLYGVNGNDTLNGLAGNDLIYGGLGNDILTGGLGLDTFIFNTVLDATTNSDAITDFTVVDDTIQLDNAVMAAIFSTTAGTTGVLNSGQFVIGASAMDANDFIIYNATTGSLSFDSDGNGAGAAVRFATLSTGLALTFNDFTVI